MLNIQIDDPELENEIQQAFGNDSRSLAIAFADFLRHRQIAADIDIAIQQFEQGLGIDMKNAIAEVRKKYE